MIGTPPHTLASKPTATPACRAAPKISAPCEASSSLFAVTTGLCLSIARRMSRSAGSIPPMTSTSTSRPFSTTSSARVVSNSCLTTGTRSFFASRIRMRSTSRSRPCLTRIRSRPVSTSETKPDPTVPQPRRPIFTFRLILRSPPFSPAVHEAPDRCPRAGPRGPPDRWTVGPGRR